MDKHESVAVLNMDTFGDYSVDFDPPVSLPVVRMEYASHLGRDFDYRYYRRSELVGSRKSETEDTKPSAIEDCDRPV